MVSHARNLRQQQFHLIQISVFHGAVGQDHHMNPVRPCSGLFFQRQFELVQIDGLFIDFDLWCLAGNCRRLDHDVNDLRDFN